MLPIYIINKSCAHTRVTLIGWMIRDSYNKGCFLENTQLSVQKLNLLARQTDGLFHSVLFQPVVCVLYAGCLVFRQSWFPFPLSQTDPYCGGRAGLAAVSQGPSSIADKHVCLSTACACLCASVCADVAEILGIKLKSHDKGIPAVRPGPECLPHTSTNMSLLKISVPRLLSGSVV